MSSGTNGHNPANPTPRGTTIPIITGQWNIHESEIPPTITGRHHNTPPEGGKK